MKAGRVKFIGIKQMDDGRLKKVLIGTIFRPAMMPFIDIRPMQFIPPGSELIPLNTRMQNIEDIVEYLVERKFRLWTFDAFR